MSEGTDRLTVVSLFSGLGGLDLGFEQEGYDVVWANDLYTYATASYRLNFRIPPVTGDIMDIPLDSIPTADVVIGGPPCQSFSLVGQRRPDDERGKLVFRFCDVIEHMRPTAFVMENVPGITASRVNGRALPDVLKAKFEDLGYQVSIMLLNATDYLVPQRRKRLIMIGCIGCRLTEPNREHFAQECYSVDPESCDLSSTAAIGDLGPCVSRGERSPYANVEPSPFARLMRVRGLPDVSLQEAPRMSETDQLLVSHIPPGGNYRDVPDEVAPGRLRRFKQTGGRTTTYGRLHPEEPAYTINTYFRRPNVGCNFHYAYPRLITPREAMRFQSIPDHFEIVRCAQDQRNALIGNAVPPLMARAIAWALRRAIQGEQNAPNQLSYFARSWPVRHLQNNNDSGVGGSRIAVVNEQ